MVSWPAGVIQKARLSHACMRHHKEQRVREMEIKEIFRKVDHCEVRIENQTHKKIKETDIKISIIISKGKSRQ